MFFIFFMFLFSSTFAKSWKNVLLTSRLYSINVPAGSSLLLRLVEYEGRELYMSSVTSQSMFSTPDYGVTTNKCPITILQESNSVPFLLYVNYNHSNFASDYSLKFTVTDFNLSQVHLCWFCNVSETGVEIDCSR